MRQPRVYLCVLFVTSGVLVIASTACHRQSTGDTDDDRVAAHSADSARHASTEKSRSSATQSFDFDDAERARYTRVEQMIQAHFAGVQVTSSGSSFKIQIRGTGSFGSGNEPFILIDGATRTTADLRSINTKDVDRIEIYKDAAASFYGSRGANGVIVIKTRHGH
jgi:TonB-dependent SusC/RagA subfamily outer membrane receptor